MRRPDRIARAVQPLWAGCALVLAAPVLCAAEPTTPAHKFAAPAAASAPTSPGGGLLQVTLSLILVLGAVFAAAWLLRKLRAGTLRGSRQGSIEVLAEQALSPRERVVLLRVGGAQLLVGVAPGNVRTLHAWRTDAGDA